MSACLSEVVLQSNTIHDGHDRVPDVQANYRLLHLSFCPTEYQNIVEATVSAGSGADVCATVLDWRSVD
jgi:hypothetical protein